MFKGTSIRITHVRWIKRGKMNPVLLQIKIISTWPLQETAQDEAHGHQPGCFRDRSLLQHYDRNK